MSLVKSKGNMYPWVTHQHSHLGGECPHKCSYCYVNSFPFGRPEKYKGPLRLIEKEFSVNYGKGKTIFIEHCNDLFSAEVPIPMIIRVLEHCKTFPKNTYVFQTKNPDRFGWLVYPESSIFGTTIETNRIIPGISGAPIPEKRMRAMEKRKGRKFVTIEPVLDFDVEILASWIDRIRPEFLNLGRIAKTIIYQSPRSKRSWNLQRN